MEIIQFEDRNLSHFSYALVSGHSMALIDPARDPEPYRALAREKGAVIEHVIETHPHADFVSSHLELHRSEGSIIHVSRLVGAEYPHQGFDSGDVVRLGGAELHALNTPGHSPDSISIAAYDENGNPVAVFTGDTLFIGDCGRPDLRETAGAITAKREELAKQMYRSLREAFNHLPDSVLVYPAHGAGSLCGKGLSAALSSTLGEERVSNWSLQPQSEAEFVRALLSDQPFVPKYFVHDVALNKKGAPDVEPSLRAVPRAQSAVQTPLWIDTRNREAYAAGHRPGALHLMDDVRFETWLGSIVSPEEPFVLVVESEAMGETLLRRIARIGYEAQVANVVVQTQPEPGDVTTMPFDTSAFDSSQYTVVDVRNPSEAAQPIFAHAINIPLNELRERATELPWDTPLLVHCAAGYRSAAGSSILRALRPGQTIEDLSVAVKEWAQLV
ncbi:MBL fold metallo-hydrolase [bacterium]|nr:MBL fold metallo-hydrolase [bacterium]